MISEDRGLTWRAATAGNDEVRIADFATSQIGAGVTTNGIVRTTDGGRTWTLAASLSDIQDLRFLTPTIAVAIRDNGMIQDGQLLRSADGGQTWIVVHSEYGLGLGDFFVPIDGSRMLARSGANHLLRTTDGGQTWAPVSGVPLGGASPGSVVHVGGGRVFVSLSLGAIYRSLDAGATWQRVFDGYAAPIEDFAFVDGQVGVAVGLYGGMLRTADGGLTWAFVSSGLTIANADLAMWDRRRGIAIAEDGFKIRTDDGVSWIPQPYTSGNQQSDVAVCALPGGFAATIGRTQVHVTTDYGRTWSARTPAVGNKYDIQFLTPSLGWVVGDSMRIEHTTDGGQTWTVQFQQPVRNALVSLDMLDAQNGWTSGSGGVILSTTDGRTWQGGLVPLSHPGARNTIQLDFVTPAAGWLVGEYGFIATTADSGRTWVDRSLPTFDEHLTAIAAVSAEEAYLGAYHRHNLTDRLLHTTDGGRSWTTVWTGDDVISHIERTPADELWLCGTRGMIVHHDPRGAFPVFGAGCAGSAGVPGLAASAPPRLGTTFTVQASRLPAAAGAAFLALGASRTSWNGTPLPLDLGAFGMPGCLLRVSVDVTAGAPASGGAAAWPLAIPPVPVLLGAPLHVQALVPDPPANARGLVLSDAATAWLGR